MYSSYTAASFPRANWNSPHKHGVNLEGALTWAFEFEDQPPFAGFRALASDGIDLPVLNVFRMFAKMSGQRLAVESSAGLDAETIRLQRRARQIPTFPRWPASTKTKSPSSSGIITTTTCPARTRTCNWRWTTCRWPTATPRLDALPH